MIGDAGKDVSEIGFRIEAVEDGGLGDGVDDGGATPANTCENRLTIKREEVEERALSALSERLMDPALFAEVCEEFTREMNRLKMDASGSLVWCRRGIVRKARISSSWSIPERRCGIREPMPVYSSLRWRT